jgi:hypothetical protein
MIDDLMKSIAQGCIPFDIQKTALEFYYSQGRTDLIGSDCEGEIMAFEAKLRKWRPALNQAYRNLAYAHRSFVVLPATAAISALRFRHEFERRGVGLCTIENSVLTVQIPAKRTTPLLSWLTQSAFEYLKK